ncbi:MAG: hypothetical protein HC763_22025 [Hydrococcus sp. CRU_1_1]|nr:hypothetical protein [Hydrococcus sp. CRU_1_1]
MSDRAVDWSYYINNSCDRLGYLKSICLRTCCLTVGWGIKALSQASL